MMANCCAYWRPERRPPPRGRDYSRYGEVALDRIVAAILGAPLSQQEVSINAKIFSIGRLVAGGEIGADFAMQTPAWLSTEIPSLDARRPWRPADLLKKMRHALADGMQHPRSRLDGRSRRSPRRVATRAGASRRPTS